MKILKTFVILIITCASFNCKNEPFNKYFGVWKITKIVHSSITWNDSKEQSKYLNKNIILNINNCQTPFDKKCNSPKLNEELYNVDDFDYNFRVNSIVDLKFKESDKINYLNVECNDLVFGIVTNGIIYYIDYDGAYYKINMASSPIKQ